MITSASNERLKLVRKLADRRWREKLGQFVVEGEDLVDAARGAGIEPVDVLVAGETVSPDLLAEVSQLAHPPRVIGVFQRDDLPREALPLGLALWHVSDPGNVGTLVRSADALGPASVALSRGCGDVFSSKGLRASMGAVFRVPVVEFEDAARPRVALVARDGVPLPQLELGESVTFVLGAERDGLPHDVVRSCDAVAHIPQSDVADSLNVSAAGAVALYELRRRASASP